MGRLVGVKTPPKFHWVLCFKVRYIKRYNSTGVTFDKFHMGRKPNHLMERVYVHLSKNCWQKSGLLTDPELTDTLFVQNF
jgi:hypothetical protein